MNNELLNKAKEAKTPEELLKIAQENGMTDFSEENAKVYFDLVNRSGELSDTELENAAGGCKKDGKRVVTLGLECPGYYSNNNNAHLWLCKKCKKPDFQCSCYGDISPNAFQFNRKNQCETCEHCKYVKGLWLCCNDKCNTI